MDKKFGHNTQKGYNFWPLGGLREQSLIKGSNTKCSSTYKCCISLKIVNQDPNSVFAKYYNIF